MIEGIGFNLTWLSSVFYSLITGLAEVLPVSASAHRLIMQALLGEGKDHILLQMFMHIGSLAALFYCCNAHLLRYGRAQKLASIPKRRRKRPLDTHSLMDISLLKTLLIPIIAVFFFYDRLNPLQNNLVTASFFLILNGVILYVPQYLPGSNRDARSLSRVDGLLIGLAGALGAIPGFSCVGTTISVASVRGADKKYMLDMALLMNIAMVIGFIAMDVLSAVATGLGTLNFTMILKFLFCGVGAFGGTLLGVRLLKSVINEYGLAVFSFYCWGLGLFTFIFYLTAA